MFIQPTPAPAVPALTRQWWREFVDSEDAWSRLMLALEVEKGRMNTHEGICAERYKNIANTMSETNAKLDRLVRATEKQSNWVSGRVIAFLAATIALLVGIAGWETSQLYAAEPGRVNVESPVHHY